jgi:hypothetical protein
MQANPEQQQQQQQRRRGILVVAGGRKLLTHLVVLLKVGAAGVARFAGGTDEACLRDTCWQETSVRVLHVQNSVC